MILEWNLLKLINENSERETKLIKGRRQAFNEQSFVESRTGETKRKDTSKANEQLWNMLPAQRILSANDWYSRVKHAGQYMVNKNGIDELGGDAHSALVPGGVLDPFVSMSKACPREDLKHKIDMESDIEKKKLIDLL